MYAVFRSPRRRTDSTPLFVHSAQKTRSPAISQCAICTNLLKSQNFSCNPCFRVVVCNRGQGKPNRPARRPRPCVGSLPRG